MSCLAMRGRVVRWLGPSAAVFVVLWQASPPAPAETYAFPRTRDVRKLNIVRAYDIPVARGVKNVVGIPAIMSFWGATNQQVVLESSFEYSLKPDQIDITADNRGMLRRNYDLTWNSPEVDSIRVKQTLVVALGCQNTLATAAKLPYSKEVQERFASLLAGGGNINTENPKVVAAAEAIMKRTRRAAEAIELACDWVNDTIEFQKGSPIATDTVLDSGKANCGGMSTLVCAVLRRMGIPAETVSATFIGGGGHTFLEAYFPDAGWVFYDVSNATRGFKSLDCLLTTGFAFRVKSPGAFKWHKGDFLDVKDASPYQEENRVIGRALRAGPRKQKIHGVRVLDGPTPASVKVRRAPMSGLIMDLTIPPGKREYVRAQVEPAPEPAADPAPAAKAEAPTATSKPAKPPSPPRPAQSEDPPARKRLKVATMYVNAGLKDKAEAILRKIIEEYPDSPEATEAARILKDIGKR